jgi:hypothetical protein
VPSKLNSLVYKTFSKAGGDHFLWNLDSKRLRILSYHMLCEDRLAEEPWVPPYFVTQSAFERHLQYLQRNAVVLPVQSRSHGHTDPHRRVKTLQPRQISVPQGTASKTNRTMAKNYQN